MLTSQEHPERGRALTLAWKDGEVLGGEKYRARSRGFTKYEQTEDAKNRENGGANVVVVWNR